MNYIRCLFYSVNSSFLLQCVRDIDDFWEERIIFTAVLISKNLVKICDEKKRSFFNQFPL